MKASRQIGLLSTVLFVIATSFAVGESATGLLNKVAIRGGLACVIGADQTDVAVALAQHGGFIVQVLDSDAAKAAAAKRTLAEQGVLGRAVYLDTWAGGALPYADNLVDVVVVSGAPVSEAEILRVLTPVRGRALLGDRVITKPALPGADDWSHRFHGPDNNPVSADTAFRMPARLQYLAMPMQTSFQGTLLAANGRRIELTDWVTKKPDRNAVAGKLLARSLYNSQQLWQRDLPKNIEPDAPICALDGDRFYLASGDDCRVLVIDAETGRDLPAITLDTNAAFRVKWLAIENGRLFALTGAALPARSPLTFIMLGANRAARQQQAAAGHTVLAVDLASGRVLWRHAEPATIDYRTIAVQGRRTYFYSEDARIACLDADGALAWENKAVTALVRPPRFANINYESACSLMVGPAGQVHVSAPGGRGGLILSAADGKLLWSDKVAGPKSFFISNQYYAGKAVYDATSGSLASASPGVEGGGCGIVTWAPGLEKGVGHVSFGMKSPCGVGAFAAGGLLLFASSQCDCWPHLRGAAGFIAAAPITAAHPLETGNAPAATLAAAAGDWPEHRGDARRTGGAAVAAGAAPRLRFVVGGPQTFNVTATHNLHGLAWLDRPTPPVTAGGLAFIGASDGSVRAVAIADGKPAWTFWTGGAVLTPPAIAGGRVYAGSADGWVYCLDALTGRLAWRWRGAPADQHIMVYGKLMSSWPVTAVLVHRGVVYGVAGQWMQNGSVTFALDAASGRLRWKHWTEPAYDALTTLQRQNPGFGPAGPLALAGTHLLVRTYLGLPAVFDTATGRRIPPGADLTAMQEKQYWMFGTRFSTSGQDTLVVDDRFILYGGYPLLGNPDMRVEKSAGKFIGIHLAEDGTIPGAGNPTWGIPSSLVAPALHGADILMVGGIGKTHRSENATSGLSLWEVKNWRDHIETLAGQTGDISDDDAADPAAQPRKSAKTAPTDAASRAKAARNKQAQNDVFGARAGAFFALDHAKARWHVPNIEINAVALCPDAALAVVGDLKTTADRLAYGEHPGFAAWNLIAFDRVTGKEHWRVALPDEPVYNGLAPAAGGAWVLALRDGSMAVVAPDATMPSVARGHGK